MKLTDKIVTEKLKTLIECFVALTDQANSNFILVCERHYAQVLIIKLVMNNFDNMSSARQYV